MWKKLSGIQWLVQGIWGAQVSLSGGCDDLGLGHISHPESFALEHQRVNPQGIMSVLHCTQRNVQQPFTGFRSQLITDLISLFPPLHWFLDFVDKFNAPQNTLSHKKIDPASCLFPA